jgi:hypothetical protein
MTSDDCPAHRGLSDQVSLPVDEKYNLHNVNWPGEFGMFNLIGESSGALYTAYSDHGNEYVLLVNAPLLTAVPCGQPNANASAKL